MIGGFATKTRRHKGSQRSKYFVNLVTWRLCGINFVFHGIAKSLAGILPFDNK